MTSRAIKLDRRRCVVPGCASARSEKHHVFPKDETWGKVWLQAVRNPLLQDLPYKQIYELGYRVCTLHFQATDYLPGLRYTFNKKPVPSLRLPVESEIVSPVVSPEATKIDLSSPSERSSSPVCTAHEFSPVKYNDLVFASEPSDRSIRRSSIDVVDTSSTPRDVTQRGVKRKFDDSQELDFEPSATEPSADNFEEIVEPTSSIRQPTSSKRQPTSSKRAWKYTKPDEKTQAIYEEVLKSRKALDNCRTKNIRYSNRIKLLEDRIKANKFYEHISHLSILQQNFIAMILRNASRDTRGRRYSMDERLFCLSIYKRSPASYRYLGTFLPLPSPSTLKKMLMIMKLDTGITETIRTLLANAAKQLDDPDDKICLLMWDEVALKTHLQFSAEKKKIIGFEDWGKDRSDKYADHALVFMLRGINTGWKIPISYYFCASQTKSSRLVSCIEDVVRAVTQAGFNIVASVCDQGSSNQKAIKQMQLDTDRVRETKNLTKYWTILIDDVEFIPLYDPPHILKCFRNNLVTKDLEFEDESKKRKLAQWDHVIRAYRVDLYAPRCNRMVPNLTDEHVIPEKIKKMKVKMMMQVFSKKLSSFMYLLARKPGTWETTDGDVLVPEEMNDTAFILDFLNDVADGINGDHRESPNSRRVPWTDESYHDAFFGEAIVRLKKMEWVDQQTKKRVSTHIPCLRNLIDTLQGFRILWRKLQELGLTCFSTRYINQDPLENFFGTIRSHDFRSNKPTTFQFEAIFKSLLLTNLTSKHTPGFNCQEDNGEFLLSCTNVLFPDTISEDDVNDRDVRESELDESEDEEWQDFPVPEKAYMYSNSRDLLKSLQTSLPFIKSCSDCTNSLKEPSLRNATSTRFRDAHLDAKRVLGRILPSRLSAKDLESRAAQWITPKINLSFVTCVKHKDSVCANLKKLIFQKYCQGILAYLNCVFDGRITPAKKRMSPPVAEAVRCYEKRIAAHKRNLKKNKNVVESGIVALATTESMEENNNLEKIEATHQM